MCSLRNIYLCTHPVTTTRSRCRIFLSLMPLPSHGHSIQGTSYFLPHSFSNELLDSLLYFLRENKTSSITFLSITVPPLPDSHVRWSEPPLLSVIPVHPELRCPVLRSENEEVEKTLVFLNYPQDSSFLSKEQRTVGERRPVGIFPMEAARSSTFPLMEPSSSYYLNSPA